MVIVIGGMIGLGKTTVAEIIGEELSLPVYYESVEGNKVLPLYYTASEEEQQKYRYPFLLQLNFLTTRFHAIKEALLHNNAVLDRSIYEDQYFASKIHDQGRMSDLEYSLYCDLLKEMMSEIDGMPKKAPDVMVYLKGTFPTVLKRIKERGRSFELAPSLVDYYHDLWKDYDEWVFHSYKASPLLVVDVDQRDIKENPEDRKWLLSELDKIYQRLGKKIS
ncbi:MAG: deoxynucleoside kinase [Eubacteriales bacterium]|nr:deoxynucleoside kinase [Eubacteriales bacterium]